MKTHLSLIAALLLCACAPEAEKPAHHPNSETKAHHEPHVVSLTSHADFTTTLTQLRAAIDARGFTTFTVIDHAAGAASVDQSLRPTTLVIFGNPKGGAPVMQSEQIMGIELPLKVLVTQAEDGAAILTWRDMKHTFREYGISDHPAADKMSAVLSAIATEAGAAVS